MFSESISSGRYQGRTAYSEMHRFIPAVASIAGPKTVDVRVRHNARAFGKSKYGLSRIYKVLLDLLTVKTIVDFSDHPLRWFGLTALPFLALSFILILWGPIRDRDRRHRIINARRYRSRIWMPWCVPGV